MLKSFLSSYLYIAAQVIKLIIDFRTNENQISIPLGILQTGIVNITWPDYMTFGGIGSIIGHEITHGFDNNGAQYDEDGNGDLFGIIKIYQPSPTGCTFTFDNSD